MENKIVLYGYSGHSYVIIDSLLGINWLPMGYFDMNKQIQNPYNLEYYGNENDNFISEHFKNYSHFPTVGDNKIRKLLVAFFLKNELKQITVKDKSSLIARKSEIGLSTYVGKNVIVNPLCKIGNGVILNTNSIIEHECNIGDYAHIAPATVLCGNVQIGESTFVGANCTVKQNISICSDVTIGAGSVVIRNIETPGTYVGNPVKRIK